MAMFPSTCTIGADIVHVGSLETLGYSSGPQSVLEGFPIGPVTLIVMGLPITKPFQKGVGTPSFVGT